MSETPTPRTDAQNCGWWNHPSMASFAAVPIHFARQLERELTEAKTEVDGSECGNLYRPHSSDLSNTDGGVS